MESSKQLADRFREVLLNGKWVTNTNFKEQLNQVSWEEAITDVGPVNNLAKITFHVNYYIDGINNVFEGGSLDIRDQFSFDMEPIQSESDWTALRETLYASAEKFAQHLEQLSAEKLDGPFVDPKYGTFRRNMEGIIEHSYYHLGQVTMLRKLIDHSSKK